MFCAYCRCLEIQYLSLWTQERLCAGTHFLMSRFYIHNGSSMNHFIPPLLFFFWKPLLQVCSRALISVNTFNFHTWVGCNFEKSRYCQAERSLGEELVSYGNFLWWNSLIGTLVLCSCCSPAQMILPVGDHIIYPPNWDTCYSEKGLGKQMRPETFLGKPGCVIPPSHQRTLQK